MMFVFIYSILYCFADKIPKIKAQKCLKFSRAHRLADKNVSYETNCDYDTPKDIIINNYNCDSICSQQHFSFNGITSLTLYIFGLLDYSKVIIAKKK